MHLIAVRLIILFALLASAAFSAIGQGTEAPPEGKPPIIIIPGITGSELINSATGKTVWFRTFRSRDDDLRLPVSPNLAENRDSLVPGDIIRSVRIIRFLPEVEIYDRLIFALERRGGYTEGKWDEPGENGHHDKFYVFPYDWRRDNVETARLLVTKIADLKKKLGKPDLRFNVIAHSMGGLITRYAAMYGDSDIPENPEPSWAGATHFDQIFLLGTPNEGSVLALNALLNGYGNLGGGVNIPFVRSITRFDTFTLPAIFQLLPHEHSLIAYDEELKPLKLDIFNVQTWDEYDWSIWRDRGYNRQFNEKERALTRTYFMAVLDRAKRFHEALNAPAKGRVPVSFHLIGAACKDTPNAIVLRHDQRRDRWETLFRPTNFTRSDGTRVTAEEQRELMLSNGDGVVTKRSLTGETVSKALNTSVIPTATEMLQCESHTRLVSNTEIQDKLFGILRLVTAN